MKEPNQYMGTREYKDYEDFRLVLEWGTLLGGTPDPAMLDLYAEMLEYSMTEEQEQED